jgi:hypothetical protein
MPTVVVEISNGDLVDAVYDEDGEEIGYRVVDNTMWEGGDCPYCQGSNIKLVGARSEVNGIGVRLWHGGYMECQDCGCDEITNVSEWIKKGGIKDDTDKPA